MRVPVLNTAELCSEKIHSGILQIPYAVGFGGHMEKQEMEMKWKQKWKTEMETLAWQHLITGLDYWTYPYYHF